MIVNIFYICYNKSMKNTFNKYGINLNEKQVNAFEIYYQTLIEYNEKFNITAITEREEVIVKHFVDSALGCGKVCGQTHIDIGSGGGFPALPLKILNDNVKLFLVEATGKKCEFLKEVVKRIGLSDVTIINARAEDLAKDLNFREQFDVCTARAVARLNTLCEYCIPFVKVGGSFVAYKGDSVEEVSESQKAVKILGGKLKENYIYSLDDAKRSLVVIEKVTNTDKKYPRGNGKERKNPL